MRGQTVFLSCKWGLIQSFSPAKCHFFHPRLNQDHPNFFFIYNPFDSDVRHSQYGRKVLLLLLLHQDFKGVIFWIFFINSLMSRNKNVHYINNIQPVQKVIYQNWTAQTAHPEINGLQWCHKDKYIYKWAMILYHITTHSVFSNLACLSLWPACHFAWIAKTLIKKLDWKLDLAANPQIWSKRFTYKYKTLKDTEAKKRHLNSKSPCYN